MEKEEREKFMKLTLGDLAKNIAHTEYGLENGRLVLYAGEEISDIKTFRARMRRYIMDNVFEEADRINKRHIITKTPPRDIEADFRKLAKEIKEASEEYPEDEFLQEILDCIKKGGF